MTNRLEGKVAIVTGASSGIGAATASFLAAQGAQVALVARRMDRLTAVSRALATGNLPIEGDLNDDSAVAAIVERVGNWAGRIDILVNNAGLSLGRPLERSTDEDFRVMLDTNVRALANLTRHALPYLRKSRGHVVNISSIAARIANPGSAMYAATKAAVSSLGESLRKEFLGDHIRMTTILPGFAETEFLDHLPEKNRREAIKQAMASIEPLKPEDVADAILYAITRPPHVSINEIVIRPTLQEL